MANKPIVVSAKILEKEYSIACPPGEEDALTASVKYIDAKMREIRSTGKVVGSERIAVMAAINVAHEMLKSQSQVQSIDEDVITRLDTLQSKINDSLDKITP
ncbi:cell division protein ZapA [Leucothrix mucor]|jgi:cell division protein ZapA|uniref:cell division protein ZapA n=1 Tax=Leucothrix mucor TaxID=45248 RepID=UPI0003B4347C|nr:cell division protein ZapA [Leucothrix mucor]